MAKTRFKGRDKFRRKMQRLPDAIVEETRKGLAAAAKDIVDMQKRLAPKESGDLARSIKWTFGDVQRTAYSQGGRGVKGRLSVRISAGNTNVRYSHLVEFGAAPHIAGGAFKGSRHPGAPAQPFFYPAYRAKKRASTARIRRAMKRGAKKAVSTA